MIVLSPIYRWLYRRRRRQGRYKIAINDRASVGPSFRRDLTTATWQSSDRGSTMRRRRRWKRILTIILLAGAACLAVWIVRESIRGLELY